jgi:hypothetical protein
LQQNQMFNENEIKSLRNCEEIEIFIWIFHEFFFHHFSNFEYTK